MSDICVFTAAYYKSGDEWKWIRRSAELLGIELHAYGVGEPFPGLVEAKIINMIKFLETRSEKYCLFADAGDSFFCWWDEGDILFSLHKYGIRLLIAAEDNCYPDADDAIRYPESLSEWHFMCPGQFIGEREHLILTLKTLQRDYVPFCDGMDQRHWVKAYLNGDMPWTMLDMWQELFVTMSGSGAAELEREWKDSTPLNIHFNGRTGGIDDWFKRIHGVSA